MNKNQITLDLNLSISLNKEDLLLYNVRTENIINYNEYLKLDDNKKSEFILYNLKHTISISNIDEIESITIDKVIY